MTAQPNDVVILDDDPGSRRSMQLLLQGRGYQVRSFASPEKLIADVKDNDPACLVSDYRMEGFDGLEVLAMLRAAGWQGRAILVTAFGTSGLAQTAQAVGFDVVLDKPFREHELVNAVRHATAGEAL
jgi:FixJ family two-component response regulator